MLKALWRWLWPQDAEKTQPSAPQLERDLVSRAEFEAEIERLEKKVEWELSEWYDKFSTLHARAAKRVQRETKANSVGRGEHQEAAAPQFSILNHRRLGSP